MCLYICDYHLTGEIRLGSPHPTCPTRDTKPAGVVRSKARLFSAMSMDAPWRRTWAPKTWVGLLLKVPPNFAFCLLQQVPWEKKNGLHLVRLHVFIHGESGEAIYIYIYTYLFINYLFVYLSIYLFIYFSICLFIYLFICIF